MNIEFLRILFTLGVLDVHIRSNIYHWWSSGGQGVEFFFLLSGYLLSLTYKPERGLLDIAKRNWIRFVPLIVTCCLIKGRGLESFYGLFMLQNTGLAFMDIPNGPAWYIAVLFWCSLFYLAIMKAMEPATRNLLISSLVFMSYILVVRVGGDRWDMIAGYIPRGLLRGVAGMGLGILLAQVCVRKAGIEILSKPKKIVYSFAELSILLYVIISCVKRELYIEEWIFRPIIHVALLSLFIMKRGYVSSFFERPIFSKLSKYCLAIYLTHAAITYYPNYFLWKGTNDYSSVGLAFLYSCVLGVSLYYLVEKPCVRYLSKVSI